ncbi:hypothetical protein OAM67_00620 [bacterium]|nr:hypothetical protein [bacterium]
MSKQVRGAWCHGNEECMREALSILRATRSLASPWFNANNLVSGQARTIDTCITRLQQHIANGETTDADMTEALNCVEVANVFRRAKYLGSSWKLRYK